MEVFMPEDDWNEPENITDERLRHSAAFFLTRIKHRYATINYEEVAKQICEYLSDRSDESKVVAIRAMSPILGGIGTNRGMVLRDALLCWAAATDPNLLPQTEAKERELENRRKAWLRVATETQRDGNFFTTEDVVDGEKPNTTQEFWAGDDGENVDQVACDEGIKNKFNFVFKEFHPDARVDYDLDLYKLVRGFILHYIFLSHNLNLVLDVNCELTKLLTNEAIASIKQDLVKMFSVYGECVLSKHELASVDSMFDENVINFISFSKLDAAKKEVPRTYEELIKLKEFAEKKLAYYAEESAKCLAGQPVALFEADKIQAIFATLKNESAVKSARMVRGELEAVIAEYLQDEPSAQLPEELMWMFRDHREGTPSSGIDTAVETGVTAIQLDTRSASPAFIA